MCIVCGPAGNRLLQSIADRYGGRTSRFFAEEIAPAITPPLDPADQTDLNGSADVILLGGPILTLRGRGEIAQAIAVRAGRIQAVGDAESTLAFRGRLTRIIDLDGRALLPGFVVADWHPPISLLCDWLEPDGTSAVMRAAADERSEEWLVLQAQESNGRDSISPMVTAASRPALAVDPEGFVRAMSPAAIALAPDEARNGTSALHVSSFLLPFLERLTASHQPLRARLRSLFGEAARHGVTTLRFCGLGTLAGEADLDLVRSAAGDASPLRIRGVVSADLVGRRARSGLLPGFGDDMFRVDTATRWIQEPRPDQKELTDAVRTLRERGWRVTLHVESPEALQLAVDALSAVEHSASPLDVSDGVECRTPLPTELCARLSRLGVSAGFMRSDDSLTDADRHSPIPLSMTQDVMVGPPRPLGGLVTAERYTSRGNANEWLLRYTIDAATRCGAGRILGSLEVGKYADFAFLDSDPRNSERNASQAKCLGTWIGGRESRP
jgi:predicted amidohydrolase YtcJ